MMFGAADRPGEQINARFGAESDHRSKVTADERTH
jgi:hypothetical protein